MKLRIFVIDDEESIRETMQWHLEDQGYEVLTAAEPKLCAIYQGHECSGEYSCGDLLFIDYNMPQMNGLDFIERMSQRGCKASAQNKIIMSGDITAIDTSKAKRLGCKIEQKPLLFSRVDEIIAECKTRIPKQRKLADLSTKAPPQNAGAA